MGDVSPQEVNKRKKNMDSQIPIENGWKQSVCTMQYPVEGNAVIDASGADDSFTAETVFDTILGKAQNRGNTLLLKNAGDGAVVSLMGGLGGGTPALVRCRVKGKNWLTLQQDNGPDVTMILSDTGSRLEEFPIMLFLRPGINQIKITLAGRGNIVLDSVRVKSMGRERLYVY